MHIVDKTHNRRIERADTLAIGDVVRGSQTVAGLESPAILITDPLMRQDGMIEGRFLANGYRAVLEPDSLVEVLKATLTIEPA